MESILARHPRAALLGWFPPVYLIRTWGRPGYAVTLIDVGVSMPSSPWWPCVLFARRRRHAAKRYQGQHGNGEGVR